MMMKARIALCLCVALLAGIFSTGRAEVARALSPERAQEEEEKAKGDETEALALPRARGAWLIELSSSGGMRPHKTSVRISSDGEIAFTSERFSQGKRVVECSLKERLSAVDLSRLREAVRAARIRAWRESYDDPAHPVCCDQPTIRLSLRQRAARGAESRRSTSWYPGSSRLRPADLAELATVAQTLMSSVSEHCRD